MPNCSRCSSERLFGGRCLDCGEVAVGAVEVTTGSFGAIQPVAPVRVPSAFVPDHVVPFAAPVSLRAAAGAEAVASLHQQTIFSMARAMRRPDALGAETDVMADPFAALDAPVSAPRRMPFLAPEDLEPDPAFASTESADEPRGTLDLLVSLSDYGPARASGKLPQPPPLPPPLPKAKATVMPASPPAPLPVTALEMADESSPMTATPMPAALPSVAAPSASAGQRFNWVPLGAVVAAVAIFLALDWRQSAIRADGFLAAAGSLVANLEGDVNPDGVLERVDRLCRERGVRCRSVSAWIRDADRAAWLRAHPTEAMPMAPDAVFYEAGFTLDATFPGWLAPWRTEAVNRASLGWASARRVARGESQLR